MISRYASDPIVMDHHGQQNANNQHPFSELQYITNSSVHPQQEPRMIPGSQGANNYTRAAPITHSTQTQRAVSQPYPSSDPAFVKQYYQPQRQQQQQHQQRHQQQHQQNTFRRSHHQDSNQRSSQDRYPRSSSSHPDLLVFDQETPSKSSKFNMRMNPFKKASETSAEEKISYKKTRNEPFRYQHSNPSDEMLELMPTIAMGYENSFDKKLFNTNRELRITGNGYYFANDPLKQQNDMLQDNQDYSQPIATRMDAPYRVEGNREEEQRHASEIEAGERVLEPIISREKETPTNNEVKCHKKTPSHPVDDYFKPMNEPAQSLRTHKPSKSRGTFKKIFRRDKREKNRSDKEKITGERETHMMVIPSEPMASYFEHESGDLRSIQQHRQPNSVIQVSQSEQQSEEEHSTIADVLKSIPIISAVFNQVDQNSGLTVQQKLLIKVAIVVWILYEVQSLLNMFTGCFIRIPDANPF
jgi:hypothetical protein